MKAGRRLKSDVSSLSRQTSALRLDTFLVVLLLATSACNRPAAQRRAPVTGDLSRGIVEPYLSAHTALASDRIDGLQANAAEIGSAARALGPSADAIDRAAGGLASADNIDDARRKFGVLSEAIDTYMDKQHLA